MYYKFCLNVIMSEHVLIPVGAKHNIQDEWEYTPLKWVKRKLAETSDEEKKKQYQQVFECTYHVITLDIRHLAKRKLIYYFEVCYQELFLHKLYKVTSNHVLEYYCSPYMKALVYRKSWQ